MFRWSKCQDKREVQPGSLKTQVEIHGSSLKAFSSTKQRRWSSHVLSVHPSGAKSMNSLLLGKARENTVKNMLSRPGRGHGRVMSDVARCRAALAQRGERTQRENATEKVGWTGRLVEKRTCNHYTKHRVEGSHHVCIPQGRNMYHVVPDIPAVPPQDMLFTSSRAALQGNLAPCSWVSTILCLALVQHRIGLMTMAAPTFSPRTRTSTRFTEQGHVKTATPYWRDGKKLSSENMFSSP